MATLWWDRLAVTPQISARVRWHVACEVHSRVRVAFVIALAACVPPGRRLAQPEPEPEPVDLIPADDFESRIAGLRATLARSGIAIVTQPVIETCKGADTAGRCVRCDVVTRERTSGLDPDELDAVAIAFGRYPPGTLARANIKDVALCRKIRFSDNPDDGPAGLAMTGERRILVSVEHFVGDHHYDSFTIGEVVHHEVFHMFDAHLDDDKEWKALNPPGFAYKDPAGGDRRPGFVNSYATTSDAEDRASTFELVMARPQKLCELARADSVLAKKTRLVWKRMAPTVGEASLKRWAPCVARLVK